MQTLQYKNKLRRISEGAEIHVTGNIFRVKDASYASDWKSYDATALVSFSLFINVKYLKNIKMELLRDDGDTKIYIARN